MKPVSRPALPPSSRLVTSFLPNNVQNKCPLVAVKYSKNGHLRHAGPHLYDDRQPSQTSVNLSPVGMKGVEMEEGRRRESGRGQKEKWRKRKHKTETRQKKEVLV